MNLSTADLKNYRTEFHETWWSYRYMYLVDPKIFRFVVKGVKAIILGVQRGWGLPYQILMISDNVELVTLIFMPCFGSLFGNCRHLENLKTQNCSSNGDRGSKGMGVTIESYGKLEISDINVDNF
jgi:hypothetical protein